MSFEVQFLLRRRSVRVPARDLLQLLGQIWPEALPMRFGEYEPRTRLTSSSISLDRFSQLWDGGSAVNWESESCWSAYVPSLEGLPGEGPLTMIKLYCDPGGVRNLGDPPPVSFDVMSAASQLLGAHLSTMRWVPDNQAIRALVSNNLELEGWWFGLDATPHVGIYIGQEVASELESPFSDSHGWQRTMLAEGAIGFFRQRPIAPPASLQATSYPHAVSAAVRPRTLLASD
jgi:hypothetical protein